MSGNQTSAPIPPPTRASKIWHRTRVGGSLALGVGLLLWGASGPAGPYLVLGCGVAMALGCVAETRALRLFPGPASGQGHGGLLGVLAVVAAAVSLTAQVQPGHVSSGFTHRFGGPCMHKRGHRRVLHRYLGVLQRTQ